MIIAITSLKGGVGKSTLTFNLAALMARDGAKVAIIDTDTNQTCTHWYGYRLDQIEAGRQLPVVDVYAGLGPALRASLANCKGKYDFILMDGMPSLDGSTNLILRAADFVLIPIIPSGPDTVALARFEDRYKEACLDRADVYPRGIPVGVIMNLVDSRSLLVREMRKLLAEHELNCFRSEIAARNIYRESFNEGLGIGDILNTKGQVANPKAVKELEAVYDELIQRLEEGQESRVNS